MEDKYIRNFEKNLAIYNSSLPAKLLKKPFKMLYSKAAYRYLKKTNKSKIIKTRTFWDEDFYVVFPDYYSTIIYKFGFVEEYLITYMLDNLRSGMTFIDIGAHFGFFSALASKIVERNGQVHSFEPTKHTFGILSKNMEIRKNVTVNNKAMWNSECRIKFYDFGIANSALNTTKEARVNEEYDELNREASYEVEATYLDKYCEQMKLMPNFVKIDAENAELEILKGMENVLDKYSPAIVIEVGDYNEENPHSRKLVDFLMGKAYHPYEYSKGEIIKHTPLKTYGYNLLLFKK